MVTVINNKEPIYDTDKFDVVLMGVSTHNMFMGNFQGKMAVKYPIIERVNNSTPYGDLRKLGKRVTIDDNSPIISLMYICTYPSRKADFIDYEALEKCLKTANAEFRGKRVLTTVLGSTKFDGKGDKEKCMEIIKENTKDLDLYVYDFEQITIKEELKRQSKYFRELREQYKGNKEAIQRIKDMAVEMRKKTFLPTDMYLNTKKNKEDDEILNF
jgi:hypothetical protein